MQLSLHPSPCTHIKNTDLEKSHNFNGSTFSTQFLSQLQWSLLPPMLDIYLREFYTIHTDVIGKWFYYQVVGLLDTYNIA